VAVALAPGKVVLSGAYSVLCGSRAIVTAVDRYVEADSSAPAAFTTDELRAAGVAPVPGFDASALRRDGLKLGLGSSAAILVACLGALALDAEGPLRDEVLAARVLDRALIAHRTAQGGGSGIDVAASCRGGTLLARCLPNHLVTERVGLPPKLVLRFWAAPKPSSTPALLAAVRSFEAAEPEAYQRLMRDQFRAAERAAQACLLGDTRALLAALGDQSAALLALGQAAGVPIVTDPVRELCEAARALGAVVLPGGAGGGDIAVYAGLAPPPQGLLALAEQHEHVDLNLAPSARGLHVRAGRC
jgi:phosphomevalonate kinase